jgi:long-subunit fatty acid transport protein
MLRALLALLLLPGTAVSAGLFTPGGGTVALGRGGAWTARASDVVGALVYNPAGLWQIDGWTLAGGTNLFSADRSFQRAPIEGLDPYPLTSKRSHVRAHPEVGVAWGLPKPDLTFALGLTTPLAPIQSWDPDGPGRYRLIEQELVQGNLHAAVAVRPVRYVALGVSLQVVVMELEETFAGQADFVSRDDEPNPENPDWDVVASFRARSVRPQFSVGVMAMPTDWLRIGVSVEPPYAFRGKGAATLSGSVAGNSPAVQVFGDGPIHVVGRDEDVSLDIGLPGHLRFGLDVSPLPGRLSFGLDVHVELWRGSGDITARDVDMALMYLDPEDEADAEPLVDSLYRSGLCPVGAILGLDCGDAESSPPGAGSSLATYRGDDGSVVVPASFRDAWSVRFGVEGRPHPAVALRLGTLVESPAIPLETQSLTMHDGWKTMLAGGMSLLLGATPANPRPLAEVNLSFAHVFYADRVVPVGESRGRTLVIEGVPSNPIDAGRYSASVNELGLSVAFHLGAIGQRLAEPVTRR